MESLGIPPLPLVDPIQHVITDPIYPYPYRFVITRLTTLVAERLHAYPDLRCLSDMHWTDLWPIKGEDVTFRKDSTSLCRAAEGGPPTDVEPAGGSL